MASSKRKHANMERELARSLTTACELAKSEFPGFEWLTHRVDYDHFPQSLVVTWVFNKDVEMHQASSSKDRARIAELTQTALEDIGISISNIETHLEFDSEERCASANGGDWAARLNLRQRSGGKHGQRH
ncbi:hypothetical protein TRP66_16670 [Pseudomonas sp. JDS28PS106]|uniref:hypothetical protein n=1 Tax=Pseudomonas sp. JDS28PS106 TaxID=2497235 RepID=UPI002FD310A6